MLFENYTPLAVRARPRKIEEYFGQDHLMGENSILRTLIESRKIRPMIFYGPPGSGKTSLGYLIKNYFTNYRFVYFSAAAFGVPELRKKVNEALQYKKRGVDTIIFVDEIHRFNKLQQDFLLPYVENSDFILIGATTENPSFYINSALLSRCSIFTFKKLQKNELIKMAKFVIKKFYSKELKPEFLESIIDYSGGDARVMMNIIESVISKKDINENNLKDYVSSYLRYDSDEHYNLISAFIKSMRASETDAALYYLARMLESGEDPRFIARRMVIFASEDIGIANSEALNLAVSTYTATEKIGMPEIGINLSHCAVYLSKSPKSRACYNAYQKALDTAKTYKNLPIPKKLVNRTSYNLNISKDESGFLPSELKDIGFFTEE
jgi:putative ATPase